MGAISVGPALRLPKMCAGRGAVNVTIASARATAPVCSPITSASAPEGTSTAITGAPAAFILAIASAYTPLTGGRNPLPKMASIRTSQAKTSRADFASPHPLKTTKGGAADFVGSFAKFVAASPRNSAGSARKRRRTSLLASCNLRATTKPSPPLLPLPQMTPKVSADGYADRAKCATADPAFSISVSEGTKNCSLVTRSISRISAEVMIFMMQLSAVSYQLSA